MLDPALIQRIRSIFLHHEARVTIGEAAELLGWSRGEMDAAIANGEIEVVGTGSGTRIEVRELAEVALQRWSLVTIEEAMGRDAASVLPPGLRTRKFTVRLPRYQIGALEVLAEDGREPVEAMLMRMFEELTDLHHERLARVIPGLGEAMAWPARTAGSVGWHSLGRHFES
jgi:excisionase family DNA binding protein